MAIKVNKSVEGEGFGKLFTGVTNMRVVAVNPTQKELQEMGFKAEKAPVYQFEKEVDGQKVPNNLIKFYLEKEVEGYTIKTAVPYFIQPIPRKDIFVDRYFAFGKDASKLDKKTRNPFEGEIDMMLFLASALGQTKGEDFFLDTINSVAAKGDVTEIKKLINDANEMGNEVKALLGVKDGKYQHVFEKKIERSWTTNLSYLWKEYVANKQYLAGIDFGPIHEVMFNAEDFKLREYTPGQTASASADQGQFGGAPVNVANVKDAFANAKTDAFASQASNGAQAVADSDDPPF